MMTGSNSTTKFLWWYLGTSSPDFIIVKLCQYSIYLVESSIISIVTLSMLIAIFASHEARQQKEYIILSGKIFSDALEGTAYVFYSINGLCAYTSDEYQMHFTKLQCLTRFFFNTMFILNIPMQGISLFIISLDRFLGTVYPTYYFKFDLKYAWRMILAQFILPIMAVISAYVMAIKENDDLNIDPYCPERNAIAPELWPYFRTIRFSAAVMGIFLYIPIFAIIWKKKTTNALGSIEKRLRKINVTIGFTVVIETTMFLIPDLLVLFNIFPGYGEISYWIMLSKGLVEVFIYIRRQKELRKAIINLITLKRIRSKIFPKPVVPSLRT